MSHSVWVSFTDVWLSLLYQRDTRTISVWRNLLLEVIICGLAPTFPAGLIAMSKQKRPFSQSKKKKSGEIHKFKDSHCKSVLSFRPKRNTRTRVPSPTNTLWSNSRKPCTRQLRGCWICRFSIWTFCKRFSSVRVRLPSAAHDQSPPIAAPLGPLWCSFTEEICGVLYCCCLLLIL